MQFLYFFIGITKISNFSLNWYIFRNNIPPLKYMSEVPQPESEAISTSHDLSLTLDPLYISARNTLIQHFTQTLV